MENVNGRLLPKSISKVLPNNAKLALALEILFLLLLGMLAVALHAKLRIPMKLPGKHGLVFMLLMVSSRYISRLPFATSLSCLGASLLLYVNVLGFHDPFMPVVYITLGVILDMLFGFTNRLGSKWWLIALAGGIGWMMIPVLRILISMVSGFPYASLLVGFVYPLATHFFFGLTGTLIGILIIKAVSKNK
ncbi:MAG: hypothetical protein A2275_19090 [Bacteroidetes bacterium RIFOXYA12_FULL_35_11]|nr:MAG: hypothetical protein A2X01_03600 [Bacteroidetes bacterium GWF2_35_48]OFY77312.1 MAG: hypothetical protein A2275_19090 [Bacteroidetes bacterium RIFOXYA12_FULL_35_11]OFY93219.1 MAG: hypothetical protein A2309_00880 [Bacteroidetes bacterium RIFOXYB2_FULL_35_7]OFY96671.1 MAG: hypothetical protein A2491_09075 [Bacteroidetes bacterium RIFOXYC12_FULL_35_7]HBX51042.1 hypothetical protein [Bacteroidales bacterium]